MQPINLKPKLLIPRPPLIELMVERINELIAKNNYYAQRIIQLENTVQKLSQKIETLEKMQVKAI